MNRQKDIVDGKDSQILSNSLDSKLREDLERLKKIRAHRGLRHFWGIRVRGQHTKTTGTFLCLDVSVFSSNQTLARSSWKDRWCVKKAWLDTLFGVLTSYLWHITVYSQNHKHALPPCIMKSRTLSASTYACSRPLSYWTCISVLPFG